MRLEKTPKTPSESTSPPKHRTSKRLKGILRGSVDTTTAPVNRKKHLHNRTFENSIGVRLIVPDQGVVTRITDATAGKVQYSPTDPGFQATNERMGQPGFAKFIMGPLIYRLVNRFPDKKLALRGITTSINGPFVEQVPGGLVLKDIAETVADGEEQGNETFNIAVLDPDNPLSIDRVTQYASYATMRRLECEDRDMADSIFPAILVYDYAGLKGAPPYKYTHTFRDGFSPEDVLLAAYVLDCPEP